MENTEKKPDAEFEKLLFEFTAIEQDYEKLSIVAREANVAVSLMDFNGNFKWINSGYTKLYGYTFEQLIKEKGKSIFGRYTDPAVKVAFGKCIVYKQTIQYEYYNVRRDGSKIWLQSILTPVLKDGKVIQLITIDADISNLKEAENEIRQQKEEIQAQSDILESSNKELEKLSIVASRTDNVVLITDGVGEIEWVNAAFTRIYGYTLDEFKTKYGSNIAVINSNSLIRDKIANCISTKKSISYESDFVTKSGNTIWLQTTMTPIVSDTNELTKIIAIDTDITKAKETEFKIQQQSEELRTANELLNERQEEILQQSEELRTANSLLEDQKELLQYQNEALQSSILYAKTIQSAILPLPDMLNRYFENFIIFRPKDIVSGDFYFFSPLPDSESSILAVVDCTGHGVPGAFMSMIGSRLLNEIIMEKKITIPRYILDFLNMGVKMALRQESSKNEDGMDVCLCRVDKIDSEKRKVTFCGAKRPLYYYQSKLSVLEKFDGTRKGIGGKYYDHLTFEEETIILEVGDILYLMSDGYVDQNATNRKRFGTNKFVELVTQIASLPILEQREYFISELAEYQGIALQRDDIVLIGAKIL